MGCFKHFAAQMLHKHVRASCERASQEHACEGSSLLLFMDGWRSAGDGGTPRIYVGNFLGLKSTFVGNQHPTCTHSHSIIDWECQHRNTSIIR